MRKEEFRGTHTPQRSMMMSSGRERFFGFDLQFFTTNIFHELIKNSFDSFFFLHTKMLIEFFLFRNENIRKKIVLD